VKYLIDTCVLIWAINGDKQKLKPFLEYFEGENNIVYVSIISYWEIVVKSSLNKIYIPDNFIDLVNASGFSWLPLEIHHLDKLKILPMIHADPFDRLLIAQALADGFHLLTVDKQIPKYF